MLLDLDDLVTDAPVRIDHRRVDRARDLGAGGLEDIGDALVQLVLGERRLRRHAPRSG